MPHHEKVIIIAGMHRSGTTLTARWLQTCGFNIGDNLLKSKYDHANPDGLHYEDLDFLRLHKNILSSANLDSDGLITDEQITLADTHIEQAQAILAARENLAQWGWKEPRTCLFLDFWMQQIPNAKVLVIYRSYEQVADSLLRRKLNHEKFLRRMYYRFQMRPVQHFAQHYIKVWTRYNRDILTTIKNTPEKSLVLRTRDVINHSAAIASYLVHNWGFNLHSIDTNTIFDNNRLHKAASYVDVNDARLAEVIDEAQAVYAELENWRTQSLEQINIGTINHG